MAGSKGSARSPGEENCREAIAADDVFEHVEQEVARLPVRIDRDAVFQALADGLNRRYLHDEILDPTWCADRDDALERVGQAIRALKRFLPRPGPTPDFPDWTAGLEREYRKLRENPTMTMSRASEGWTRRVGRPEAFWRHETEAALRKLGVSKLRRADLIEAAGLIRKRRKRTPRPDLPGR